MMPEGTALLRFALGDKEAGELVKRAKAAVKSKSVFGPRLDIAGDRVIEYTFWIVFTYVGILPLFVILLVLVRHSFVDALMGARGTSSKLKTRFARIVYGSKAGRGWINVVKPATFIYLAFVYIAGWPLWIGYVLTAVLVTYIMLRGAAEVHEAFS